MVVNEPDCCEAGPPHWQVPVLRIDDRVVGGVAGGIASELGVDPLWTRLGFVALFAAGGWGALLYLVLWGGLAQLEYLGKAPSHPPTPKARTGRSRLLGLVLIVGGLVLFFGGLPGLPPVMVWPMGVLGVGLVISWRQLGPGPDSGRRLSMAQILGGLLVALIGAVLLLGTAFEIDLGDARNWAAIAFAGGLIALSTPWWWRMLQQLDAERQARVRSDERAEVAAHIHDSVLQTLTLIQKHGDEPQLMRNLARRQERELRNWLDPARADRLGASLRGQLDDMATAIEDLHGVPVEVVAVGDCLVTEPVGAALAAAREAAVNAAKHSGADQIDVYAEVGETTVELFVRDTGRGFDPDLVSADRRGISESIEGRMERAGGHAVILTEPGSGTEVEITVPRPSQHAAESSEP